MGYRRKMLEYRKAQKNRNSTKHMEGSLYHVKGTNLKVNYAALQRQCLKKNMYSTLRMAEHIQQKLLAERGEKLRIYECNNCGFYHITKRV